MSQNSRIEWTQATWNPIVGCSIVSPGCTNCYAMRDAWRKHHNPAIPHYHGLTKQVNGNAVWTGKLAQAPDHILLEPLKRKKPTTYFVNSMSDLFHEDCPDEWIDRVFAVMALCPQHTFQLLTKRAERMRSYFDDVEDRAMRIGCALGDMLDGDWIWKEGKQYRAQIEGFISLAHGMTPDDQFFSREEFLPLPNVWLGVSAERQQEADERIPLLLQTPAAIRFVSAEPLLGQIDPTRIQIPRTYGSFLFDALRGAGRDHHGEPFVSDMDGSHLDWIIVGGESGMGARPMHPQWARDIRDQCKAAAVAFFFKQWGEYSPTPSGGRTDRIHAFKERGACHAVLHPDGDVVRVGKKAAGRLLDGQLHDAMPGGQSR